VWNRLWYAGKGTELKGEVLGIDISHYYKPSKIVFTLAVKLLRHGYIIELANYYSSPKLFVMLNVLETDAVTTVRSNRKGLQDVMGKKLKKGDVSVSFRRKPMALKWKDKRHVCMLSSIHNEEMQIVRDKKGGGKQQPKVCIDYDTMGIADLSD
jgi:hypothetical protein